MTEIPKNIDEAWGLFNSRRFEHGRDESMYNSFSTALAGLFASTPSPVDRDDVDTCPICADLLLSDDICATDIELGICHASCLEGSPVVDLNTGGPIEDGKLDTYRYSDLDRHPDDVAVDAFAAAMKAKLAAKRAQGYGGWSDPAQCRVEFLSRKLRQHMVKGDPVDVGNFAMMLHQRGSQITKPDGWSEQESFQDRVQPWMMECFGPMIAGDREERNHRFLEEALELVQSTGCTAHEAHQLVDYVYGRAVGEPHQEVGGVMVTLAALCLANELNMQEAAETELARIWTKVEAIRAKQAAKPKHSPLPGPSQAEVI
jgi:hypothetical protein